MPDALNVALINEIKKYPVLYDINDENYQNTGFRSKSE